MLDSGLMDIRKMALEVARHGSGQDLILAHISPREAEELAENYGGDVNPHTGLPQFDLWSRIGGVLGAPTKWMGDATNRVWNSKVGDWVQKITPKPLRSMVHTGMNEATSGFFPGVIPGASGSIEDAKQQGTKTAGGNIVGQAAALLAGYNGGFSGGDGLSSYSGYVKQLTGLLNASKTGSSTTPQQAQQATQSGNAMKAQIQKEYEPYPEQQEQMQTELDYIDRLVAAVHASSKAPPAPDASAEQRAITEEA